MLETSASILKQKILKAHIDVSRKKLKRLELNVECRAKVMAPKEENDRTVLLNIELNIGTENDDLQISFEADTIFELEKIPDNYDSVAEQVLIPIARDSLFEKLDEILCSMGYEKMNLAEKS